MVMRFGLFVFFFRVTRDPLAFIPFGGLLKVGPVCRMFGYIY